MKWIKIIIACCTIFIISCQKVLVAPVEVKVNNVFDVPQSTITNGQEIQFNLAKDGVYTLTLTDTITNQVMTRERFNGQIGINKKKIYTKGLQSKYLYLLLEDVTKNKISKTTIIIN